MRKNLIALFALLTVAVIFCAVALAQGWIASALWNAVLAPVNGAKEMTTLQGVGLLALFSLLNKNAFSKAPVKFVRATGEIETAVKEAGHKAAVLEGARRAAQNFRAGKL